MQKSTRSSRTSSTENVTQNWKCHIRIKLNNLRSHCNVAKFHWIPWSNKKSPPPTYNNTPQLSENHYIKTWLLVWRWSCPSWPWLWSPAPHRGSMSPTPSDWYPTASVNWRTKSSKSSAALATSGPSLASHSGEPLAHYLPDLSPSDLYDRLSWRFLVLTCLKVREEVRERGGDETAIRDFRWE